jgi:thioesterase domain-containing protein
VDVGLPWVAPLPPEKEIQRRFVGDLLGIAGAQPEGLAAVFAGHPDDIASARMFAEVERSGILPEEFDADLLEDRYAVFRAHIEALFAFEVKGVYQGPVTHVMSAGSDPQYMRWDGVAADLTEHTVPGDHHSIWAAGNLDTLAQRVRGALASG